VVFKTDMKKTLHLNVPPSIGFDRNNLELYLLKKEGLSHKPDDFHIVLKKRSVDARQKKVKVNIEVGLYTDQNAEPLSNFKKNYCDVSKKKQAVIIGSGPAGLFAALRLIELGIKPIVLERGKDVQSRRRDLAAIIKDHIVNPNSNYCFGEGGAGTYSDGKLYTRSKKRGNVRRALEILHAHGAREEILIDAHPHIGTNKLPKIVAEIRKSIIESGGEIKFETRATEFILENNQIKGAITENGESIYGIGVILATGHSARDIFFQLQKQNIYIEPKPFAIGVRVEHQQNLIDQIQYSCTKSRDPYLPASSYTLVHQASYRGIQRGVFSFCMCPGGFIVPSATAPGEIVVNGMSPSRRDSQYANSGIVVTVEDQDMDKYKDKGALKGLFVQMEIEKHAFELGNGTQSAPAQRIDDFVNNKISSTLLPTSYQPGIYSADMHGLLPDFISQSLKQGFEAFNKKMKGYINPEAQLIGIESRTSSPVRIPRDKDTLEHIQISRLYPCGEGAGYAGGIISAAIDGERCAEQLAEKYGRL